jgi:predicted RNA-binding protein YlxR (DUF448 family)
MAGRGAYLHDRQDCWDRGLQGVLAEALKTTLSAEDKERLLEYMANLSEEIPAQ